MFYNLKKEMKRLALLIGSPSHPNTTNAGIYLEGVKTDIENIYGFLSSSIGGSWRKEEIKVFCPNPTYSEVESYLKSCEDVDFAFVYFSGHGYTDNQEKPRVVFNQKEEPFVIEDLANRAKRQITIIDACRTYPEYIGFDGITLLESIDFPNPNPVSARASYEKHILKIPATRVLLFATSKGSVSMDYGSKYGGLFSSSLLSVMKNKYKAENKEIFNIAEVFKTAKINTQKNKAKQRPEIYISDDNALSLPFAVKPDYNPQQIKLCQKKSNNNLIEDIAKGALIGAGIILTGILIGSLINDKKK